jgi:hydrogenase expression/formation protein HypC
MCLGIPGEVLELFEQDALRMGRVRFGAATRDVCLAYHPEAVVGDFVLVHVGFAIAVIDRDEAARVWQELAALDESAEPPAEGSGA